MAMFGSSTLAMRIRQDLYDIARAAEEEGRTPAEVLADLVAVMEVWLEFHMNVRED